MKDAKPPEYRSLGVLVYLLLAGGAIITIGWFLVATQNNASLLPCLAGIGMVVASVILDAMRTWMKRNP